jgi:hypothetical protein
MIEITALTNSPKQKFNLVIDGYDVAKIYLEFKPQQEGWFLSLNWGDSFSIKNERVSTSPNLLRQFKNILPFGLLISGTDEIDPITIDSWVKTNQMILIEQGELDDIEALYVK